MHQTTNVATRLTWFLVMVGCALVVVSSIPYLLPGLRHPFLLERIPLSLDGLWLATLRIHVAGGLVCLPAGLFLFARRARARWPGLHAVVGRGYALVALFLMFPTGVYLAAHSKHAWASGAGFLLSALIMAVTTVDTVAAARRGEEARHRAAALHSYAQVASAITFRIYHALFQLFEVSYETNYVASVWLSVVGNAVVAELWRHHENSHRIERPVLGLVVER